MTLEATVFQRGGVGFYAAEKPAANGDLNAGQHFLSCGAKLAKAVRHTSSE